MDNEIPRYAVIPTYNRPQMALECIKSLTDQVDVIFVIDNGDEELMPEPPDDRTLTPYYVARVDQQPPNLSQLWNLGLDLAEADARRLDVDAWDVVVVNDDTLLSADWVDSVSAAVRREHAVAGCSGPVNVVHRTAAPIPLHTRMQGWAFLLRGETFIRADEELAWWFGDDDLGWRAAQMGGMAMVAGPLATNRLPNGHMDRPDLQAQACKDGDRFEQKWGVRPW